MISVCIATYNGEELIGEQLSSILSQLGPQDEIVISDDGSTDNTLEVAKGFGDDRIHIYKGPAKGSLIYNFENALRNAKGDIIFLSDQDDVWKSNKVETFIKHLKTSTCVVSDATVVDGNLNTTSESFYRLNRTKTGKLYNLLIKNGYLGCCMAFRRELLDAALPFPSNIPMHDIWLGNVAAFKYSVKFIPERLMLFRRHGHNNSSTASKSVSSLRDKTSFRLNIIKDIIKIKR